ncbi:MAG: hypothetical protein JNK37_00075 [Verrucomicrobiales bacterium]|nr:hypothetical protein [Verrucomicrobiales bacterium]
MSREFDKPNPRNSPVFIFLASIITAFVAGIMTWIFLQEKVEAEVKTVIRKMAENGEIPVGPPGPKGEPGDGLVVIQSDEIIAEVNGETSFFTATFSPSLPEGKVQAIWHVVVRPSPISDGFTSGIQATNRAGNIGLEVSAERRVRIHAYVYVAIQKPNPLAQATASP